MGSFKKCRNTMTTENMFAQDNDRRVREACHQTFEQLVLRVRKNLAPHLKSLMGPWIVGQSDVYAPAASAAKSAFQAAFPPAKQSEAVIFCKEEVIHVCETNVGFGGLSCAITASVLMLRSFRTLMQNGLLCSTSVKIC